MKNKHRKLIIALIGIAIIMTTIYLINQATTGIKGSLQGQAYLEILGLIVIVGTEQKIINKIIKEIDKIGEQPIKTWIDSKIPKQEEMNERLEINSLKEDLEKPRKPIKEEEKEWNNYLNEPGDV